MWSAIFCAAARSASIANFAAFRGVEFASRSAEAAVNGGVKAEPLPAPLCAPTSERLYIRCAR